MVAGRKGPSEVEGGVGEGEVGAGDGVVGYAGIAEEEGSVRRWEGDGEIIWSPWERGEEVGINEGGAGTSGEDDAVMAWEKGEAMEGVEVGSGEKIVEGGPLKGSGHALNLFWAKRHGGCNEGVEKGGGVCGGVVLD